jgi:DNA repair exonuclease SbcCD nuclease subunit
MSIDKLHNCLECLEWIYDEAVRRGIKNVIFAGDLFHDRHKINTYAYDSTFTILQKYKDLVNSYYVLGNHDLYYRTNSLISSVNPLAYVVNVIDSPTKVTIDGRDIDFLPYTEKPSEDLAKIPKKAEILISHLSVQDAILNSKFKIKYTSDFEEKIQDIPTDIFQDYRKVFLGHFHYRQKVTDKIEYIGSPLQLSFGEANDQKGYLILDLETLETEFVENTFSPKYYVFSYKDDLSSLDLDKQFVRITIPQHENVNHLEIKNRITSDKNPKSIEMIFTQDDVSDTKITEELGKIDLLATDTPSIIEKFVSMSETTLDKSLLVEIGNKIFQSLGTDDYEF